MNVFQQLPQKVVCHRPTNNISTEWHEPRRTDSVVFLDIGIISSYLGVHDEEETEASVANGLRIHGGFDISAKRRTVVSIPGETPDEVARGRRTGRSKVKLRWLCHFLSTKFVAFQTGVAYSN